MKPDETPQSTESTTDHRAESGDSRSRRGFLKKAAAVGVLGMTGMTAAAATSEPVRAGSWEGPYRLYRGQETDLESRWTSQIAIDGAGDYNDYTVWADNPYESEDSLRPVGEYLEPSDDLDTVKEDHAFGEVNDALPGSGSDEDWAYVDSYLYEDKITCRCTSGYIDVWDREVDL